MRSGVTEKTLSGQVSASLPIGLLKKPNMNKSFEDLIRNVEKWGMDNGLTPTPITKKTQALCIQEETMEFCESSETGELGDVQVTLILHAHIFGIDPVALFKEAMNYISRLSNPFNVDRDFYYSAAKIGQATRKENLSNLEAHLTEYLTLIFSFALQFGYDPQACLNEAYEKISNRKVKKVNGSLVKEEDL